MWHNGRRESSEIAQLFLKLPTRPNSEIKSLDQENNLAPPGIDSAPALKGIQRPIELYRIVQPSAVRGRLEAAAAARGLTPFVGREDEVRLLTNRWESAQDGEGQVALIIGEAGIGKSRPVQRSMN